MIETLTRGFGRPGALEPVQVAGEDLLEWLVSRRVVPAAWRARSEELQAAVARAVAAVPARTPAAALLSAHAARHARIGLHDARAVLAALRESEPQERGVFGAYGSPALRAWDGLLRAWARANAHVADAADELACVRRFDAPSARAAAARARAEAAECAARAEDFARAAARASEEHTRLCRDFGVEAAAAGDVRVRLTAPAVRRLRAVFGDVAAAAADPLAPLAHAADFYERFAAFSFGEEDGGSEGSQPRLPALRAAAKAAAAQSVGEALAEVSAVSRCNVDAVLAKARDFRAKAAATGGEEEDAGDKEEEQNGVVVAFVWDSAWRKLFGIDLAELRAFLLQRRSEMQDADAGKSAGAEFIVPSGMPAHTLEQIETYLAAVTKVSEMLEGRRTQELIELRESKHYVDRIAAMLEAKLEGARQAEEAKEAAEAQRKSLLAQAEEEDAKAAALDRRAAELVGFLVEDLAALFPGREIIIS